MLSRAIKFIFLLLIISCRSVNIESNTNSFVIVHNKKSITKQELIHWQHKDIINDTIPGISLDKAYNELINYKKGDTVIVAVIDTGIDINHIEIKDFIWVNKNEIPNNGLDDDKNGYVDDINGWNFLTNSKNENIVYENWELVRILKKYKRYFKEKDTINLDLQDQQYFKEYKRAKESYKLSLSTLEEDIEYIEKFASDQEKAKEVLKKYFPDENYTIDDIYKIDPKGDEVLKQHLMNRITSLYYNMDDQWIAYYQEDNKVVKNYKLNLNYEGRENVDNNHFYGNNDVSGDLKVESHGTNVASIIASNRNNNSRLKGITNMVKIMPIRVVPQGDEYDNDVANGIRYAVDNGAKVINMSFGKEFSMNKKVVTQAIQYATKNNVLLVTASGNDNMNVDKNYYFPNDIENNKEISDCYINVGANTYHINDKILASFSNYGKKNVDVFAPGDDIYVASPNNKYETNGGTSFAAPIVSGLAALIWSYYPKLKASEMKKIILNSGNVYQVNITLDDQKNTIPFSELSKSGKVVNAYNALVLAEKMSKNKD
ncbi:S8 family serine peptidase [uncultured Aquimarina sp.]|uniref:S8 family serine peptidase n=1 Tax=uncultured Aquimarina sp. TaxID=575652 RepID=UPI002604F6AB|nr:S8 family serine peptidase [uncultured Aquimarina sp.]